MPSPIGHAVAGLIVGLAGEPRAAQRRVPWKFLAVCTVLAMLPDLDYIYPPSHRGPTHSIGAVVIVTLIAAAITRWRTGHTRWGVALICGTAYLSHIVMDWLGQDPTITPGVQALWPLSDTLFISGWDLFRSTWRIEPLAPVNFVHNVKTLAQEMLILLPILIWLVVRRSKQRRA